ncbi:MAG: hypothetical protein JW806_06465 [Sedimentisphaerales bacterium]|nr:hypothetical protein [Sedimentisphaerales bacterium]
MKIVNFLLLAAVSLVMVFLAGCGIEEPAERLTPEPWPLTWKMPEAYRDIEVGKSTSVEILDGIKRHKKEMISESESVIASWGEKKKGSQLWMTMVGFDEEEFTVTRKYFLTVDEKPWYVNLNIKTYGQQMRFDAEITVDEETLSEPYTSQNQKRIAIMRKSLEDFRDDAMQVRQDSKVLDVGAMMTNQTFETILVKLDQSPALAAKLSEKNGLDFDHPSLGDGRVQMILNDNIVTFKIRVAMEFAPLKPMWMIWKGK